MASEKSDTMDAATVEGAIARVCREADETVPMSLLCDAAARASAGDLRSLVAQLMEAAANSGAGGRDAAASEKHRRAVLLKFLWQTHQKLLRLLVVAKWTGQVYGHMSSPAASARLRS